MDGLQRLEIGQADRLNECKLSLIMGVKGPRNQINVCLKLARNLLHVQHSIWTFFHEPYLWYVDENTFHACEIEPQKQQQFSAYYGKENQITPTHRHYPQFSKTLAQIGFKHQRMIAFLLVINQKPIGQVIFFDDLTAPFEQNGIDLVAELLTGTLGYVELKFDFAELQESYEELSALNFSRTKFFQVIAHDLRAPFHGLLGFSEVLADEIDTLDSPQIQNIACYLNDTAKSTYHLLENLLNWAMAEGGHFVYHPINFKLQQVTHIVKDVLMSLAKQKNIELIEEIAADILVCADMNMLTSILQNLTSNALKFTPIDGTGKVTISACRDGDYISISIADTGMGMNQTQLEKVFEPRLKLSLKGTAGEKGTGLGLVLCKRFVDFNKGQISVTSIEGQGTTFVVKIPVATDHHAVLQGQLQKQAIY